MRVEEQEEFTTATFTIAAMLVCHFRYYIVVWFIERFIKKEAILFLSLFKSLLPLLLIAILHYLDTASTVIG